MFDLVEMHTEDKLILHGLFVAPKNDNPTMIYLHGWEGNFYQNRFIKSIAATLESKGYGFLSIRTRSSDLISELPTTDGKWMKAGSWNQKLEDAHIDISAAVKFLKDEGYNNIILSGHSLGTMKVVRYLFEGKYRAEIQKLVLISPFDNAFILYAGGEQEQLEKLKIAKQHINAGFGEEFISGGFAYTNMSWKTFASWGNMDDFGKMWWFSNKEYDFPVLTKINIPVRTVIGSIDEHVYDKEEAMNIMKKYIKNFDYQIIENALHSYLGFEDELAKIIYDFVK